MKHFCRIIAVGALLAAGIGSANATWRFGVKAGMNFDNLKLHDLEEFKDNFTDVDNRTGWTAGLMTEFEVPLVGFCVDASLMYTRMENSFKIPYLEPGDQQATTVTTNAGRNFIEIPINVKWKLQIPVIAKIVKPYILTGPDFAFKLGKNPYSSVVKAKTCQVAWNVGVGVELFQHLQVTGQYGFGINKVAEDVLNINTSDLKVKNNYWTVTAAFLF